MLFNQVQWAMEHEWCIGYQELNTLGIFKVIVRDDMVEGRLSFIDYSMLREWAGY